MADQVVRMVPALPQAADRMLEQEANMPSGKYSNESMLELDFAILGLLPEEGTKFGYHNLGLKVKTLKDKLGAEFVTSDQINARLRWLRAREYVVATIVMPVGTGAGWQRTPKGREAWVDRPSDMLPDAPRE